MKNYLSNRFIHFLLLLLVVTLTNKPTLFAQETKAGFKGGINLSNLYIAQADDENAKIGFNAGVFVKSSFTPFFALQPELLYSLQGSQVTYKALLFGSGGKLRYNLGYINLPLLAVVNVTKHFNIHAGPYGGILAFAAVKDVDDQGNTNYADELDRDDFHTVDYGLSGGFGFDFETGMIGLRYNYGLQQIGKEGTSLGNATKDSKNSVFQLYAGFKF